MAMKAITSRDLETRLTPDAIPAMRFVMANKEDCDWLDQPHATDAIRYWKGDASIFITHIRWKVEGESEVRCEISRTEAVETWIKAVNTYDQVINAQWALSVNRPRGPDGDHLYPQDRKEYSEVTALLNKYQQLLRLSFAFFTTLGDIESSMVIPATWPDRKIFASTHIINPSDPTILWPYTVIKALGALNEEEDAIFFVQMVNLRYNLVFRPLIQLSAAVQEQAIKWKGAIAIMEAKELQVEAKKPEVEAQECEMPRLVKSGENSPTAGSPIIGTPVDPSSLALMASGVAALRKMDPRKSRFGSRTPS